MQNRVYVMGPARVGKSAFVNFMLGHQFQLDDCEIDLVNVKDQSRPFADIHSYLSALPTDEIKEFAHGNYVYCDCPEPTKTTQTNEQLPMRSVVVLSGYSLGVTGADFSYLANQVHSLTGGDYRNILFVLNSKGDARLNLSYYQGLIKDLIEKASEQLRKTKELITEIKASTPQNMSLQKKLIRFFKARPGKMENVLQQAEALQRDIEGQIKLLSSLHEDNAIVWSSHADTDCRAKALVKLDQMQGAKPDVQVTSALAARC